MKKIFFSILTFFWCYIIFGQTIPLKGVTFGIGLGWSYLGKTPNDYFLTPDASHKLQVQKLSNSSMVISSLITIKLGDLSLQTQQNGTTTKQKLVSTNRTETLTASSGVWTGKNFIDVAGSTITPPTHKAPKFSERLAINVGLNLAEVNDGNISFNKAIDGGIGLGCYLNEFTQLSLSFDMIRIRQLRDYIIDNYRNLSIPNGNEVFNALDEKNNTLFYNKYFPGLSIKIIFSLGSK